MASAVVEGLRKKTDAAYANLTRQLEGMEPYLDRADASGQWTTREVLSHLLSEPGWDPVATLRTFTTGPLALIEVKPGETHLTAERKKMSLAQYRTALDAQRRAVFGHLAGLSDADMQGRKARIPLFKQITGNEEVPLAVFVGGFFDYHWNDHAGQLAKIRKAVGLPDAK